MHVRDKDGAAERNERKKDSLFGDSKGVVNESLHDISEFEIFFSKFGFRLFSFFCFVFVFFLVLVFFLVVVKNREKMQRSKSNSDF